jgi:hypothetical protein
MPGRVILIGTTNPDALSSVMVQLSNGTYVITPGQAVFQAPFAAIQPNSTKGMSYWLLSDRAGFSGTNANLYSEMVFDCDSDTISGTFTRSDLSVDVVLVIPPTKLTFAPSETRLDFQVRYTQVDDPAETLEPPAWVAALRS